MEKPDRGKEPIQKVCKKVSLPQRLGTLEPTGTILGGRRWVLTWMILL